MSAAPFFCGAISMELLFLLAIAGVIAASAKVWLVIVTRWRQQLPLLPYEPRRPALWTFVDLLAIAVAYIAMNFLFILLFFGKSGGGGDLELLNVAAALVATSLANLITAAFAIVWIRRRTGASWTDLGLCFDRAKADLQLGLATFAAVSVPVYLLQALLSRFVTEQHPIIDLLQRHQQPWVLALCTVSAVIVAPATEEFFFRVLLQGWFESLGSSATGFATGADADPTIPPSAPAVDPPQVEPIGAGLIDPQNPYSPSVSTATPVDDLPNGVVRAELVDRSAAMPIASKSWSRLAIVFSSLVFSLMHLGHGADPIPLFFLALALGYLYQRTGRILPSIIVHFCLNATSLIALWFSLSFGVE